MTWTAGLDLERRPAILCFAMCRLHGSASGRHVVPCVVMPWINACMMQDPMRRAIEAIITLFPCCVCRAPSQVIELQAGQHVHLTNDASAQASSSVLPCNWPGQQLSIPYTRVQHCKPVGVDPHAHAGSQPKSCTIHNEHSCSHSLQSAE